MAAQDFDIDSLAAYLHLAPLQVARMADRGKLPGRKVSGQWRFTVAEIHHWLEERIGASDEEQLVKMESVLERPHEEVISIAGLLPLEAIAVPLLAKTRGSVIGRMCELAAETGLLWDAERMTDAVRERENLHPTALDIGVALLHPRRPLPTLLVEPFLALGRTYQGIPFGGARGGLTDIFFLLLSTDDRTHLRMLARLSRLLGDNTTLEGLRCCEDAVSTRDWIALREAELFGGG